MTTRLIRVWQSGQKINTWPVKPPVLEGCLETGHQHSKLLLIESWCTLSVSRVAFNKQEEFDWLFQLNYRSPFYIFDGRVMFGISKTCDVWNFKNVWCLAASIKLIRRKLLRTHIKRLHCDGTTRTFFRVMSLSSNLLILSDQHYYIHKGIRQQIYQEH
jgi:hypothetical protein